MSKLYILNRTGSKFDTFTINGMLENEISIVKFNSMLNANTLNGSALEFLKKFDFFEFLFINRKYSMMEDEKVFWEEVEDTVKEKVYIKELPFYLVVEKVIDCIMDIMYERCIYYKQLSSNYVQWVEERIDNYSKADLELIQDTANFSIINDHGTVYIIDMLSKTCDCGLWTFCIPCKHALFLIKNSKLEVHSKITVENLVDENYTIKHMRKYYSEDQFVFIPKRKIFPTNLLPPKYYNPEKSCKRSNSTDGEQDVKKIKYFTL